MNNRRWDTLVFGLLLVWIVWAVAPQAAFSQGLQSNHGVLRAVPLRQPVVVDGKLDEWDVSAEIVSYGVRRLRDRYSVRVAAMWDAEAVYLGLKWRDPTPMINNVDVDATPGDGWMADSFQGRFIVSGRQVHLTTCYSSKKDKTAAVIEYDAALNQAGRRVFVSPGKTTQDPTGFAQAFVSDSDARGYTQELRIPWVLLGKDFRPIAGGKIGFTGEYFWGNASGTTWPAVMWSDPINPKNPVRIVIYQNPGVWGEMELLGQGNLPRASERDDELRLVGTTPLRFEVPGDATHFSLVIEDASGRRVRNLASHLRVEDYEVRRDRTQTDSGGKNQPAKTSAASQPRESLTAKSSTKMIEVPWDARPDGAWNPDRLLFLDDQVVAAGTYTARCVVHRGIGVTYAGSFYNPGAPPWPTANGTGAWGFDHTGPCAVAAMPKEANTKGRVFLGWHHGECGVGFIGLDGNGKKIWEWLRRGVGATHIAASTQFVYFCFEEGGKTAIGKVHPDNGEQLNFSNGLLDIPLAAPPTGLAARGANLLVSLASANKVLWLNAETAAIQHEFPVPGAGAVTFVGDDRFVVTSGDQWLEGELSRRSITPVPNSKASQPTMSDAMPLAFGAGKLFYGDSLDANVKAVPAIDKRRQGETAIGEPGGHQPGVWRAQRMNMPRAIAVEEQAAGSVHVWVVEASHSPRRISVWDASTGKLVRDYIGNTRYSGTGGFLSDDVLGIGFVDGVKYQLDLPAGTYTPLEVLGGTPTPRPSEHNGFTLGKGAGNFANPYHFLSSASGREHEYIVEAGGTQPMVFMKRGDRWQCVAALGSAQQQFPEKVTKAPSPTAVFSWHDANGDGHQQASEITWRDLGVKQVFQCGWGYRCGRDLVFYHSGWAFRPVRFTPEGVPVYDVSKAERLPGELGQVKGDIHKTRFGYVADTSTGEVVDRRNVVHGLHFITGFDQSGRLVWKYPSYWVSVHGAFTAPMAMPGVLMGVLKTSGVIEGVAAQPGAVKSGESRLDRALTATEATHDVISLRGNIGQEFLIRDDGVYLAELFTDQRMAPADLPPTRDIVGAPINETTLGGEPFNGWIGRQRDGKVRMTYGLTDVRIAEVVGLDRVTELPSQSIVIGEAELAAARVFQPKSTVTQVTEAIIPRGGAFTDANLTETGFFADSQDVLVIRSGREELGRARLRWDESGLHLACQVADATPWVNKGTSGPLAFKSGDSVNLFASTTDSAMPDQLAGARMLLTSLRGKPTAMVYRPAGPGNSAYVFESPVRKSAFAHVAESSEIRFATQPGNGSYSLRCTIPWSELAIQPAKGMKIRGDIGLLFGDDVGASTAQRVHWVDQATNVVNDSPTEAEFFPARWGTWTLLDTEQRTANVPAKTLPVQPAASKPPAPNVAGWKTVYRETFDECPVGLKTGEGVLAHWETGSALGVVREGGKDSTSGRYLAQLTPWQYFNFGPVFKVDLKNHPHTHVRVRFNLYTFGEWRGLHGQGSPHTIGLHDSRASQPWSKYFALATVEGSKQSWPDLIHAATHPAATGATRDDRIDTAQSHQNDHRWPVTMEYVSGSDTLRFAVLSGWHSLGGPPLPEPTFGLDDIHVEVLDARALHGLTPLDGPRADPRDSSSSQATEPTKLLPAFRWISVKSAAPNRGATTSQPNAVAQAKPERKVELRFALDSPGYVTLVIESAEGVRVKNLVGETRFAAGEHVVIWDGRDETSKNFRVCGVYDIDPQPVAKGQYRVRGLVRPAIEARYELTVNNAGNPPWPKQDGTGRWLADHSPPSDVLFLPPGRVAHQGSVHDASYRPGAADFISTDEPLVLIASHVAESGDGLVWCGLNGEKRQGIRSLGAGGGWCGAERIARDAGPMAEASVYAYLATGWKNTFELRTLPAGEVIHSMEVDTPGEVHCLGVAVHNRLLAATLSPVRVREELRRANGQENGQSSSQTWGLLWLFDTVARKPLGTLPLEEVGGVTFDDQGRLFVVVNKQIVKLEGLDRQRSAPLTDVPLAKLTEHPALSDPRQLMFDSGELFVADHGTSHQIHVVDTQGRQLRTIGRPGGAKLGAYQQDAMQKPAGMTIDSRGKLWVAESDLSPKRVSVWSRDGKFERAYYGPPGYGGGGSLDPFDPTRFYLSYGSGLEFQVDWLTRTSRPVHRYWIEDAAALRLGGDWHAAPETPLVVAGRRYLTNAFSNSPGGFGQVVGVWRIENEQAIPAAAAGAVSAWPPLNADEFKQLTPEKADRGKTFFVWSDLNGDQRPQANEVTTTTDDGIQRNNGKHVGGIYVGPDLSLTTSFGLHLKPLRFTDRGVPVYDAAQAQRLVRKLEYHWVPYDAVVSSDGWFITKAEPLRGFHDGKQLWSYPNQWPELHACLREPPPLSSPGKFIGTMRWLGHPISPQGSDVGEIFALTGYYGQICLITADGLCVGTLFQDARATGYFNAFEKLTSAQPGTLMNEASLQTECFFDTITQTTDGRVYLQAGKSQCNIVRLDGLEAIRRVPTEVFELE